MFVLLSITRPLGAQQAPKGPRGIADESAKPIVPPLRVHMIGGGVSGMVQQLDGIDCKGCSIINADLTYAGGAFKCENCTISARSLTFEGAAWNTLQLLQFVGAIPKPPQTPVPQKPQIMTAELKQQKTVSWVSLAGLKY